jgi:hypothetical protein
MSKMIHYVSNSLDYCSSLNFSASLLLSYSWISFSYDLAEFRIVDIKRYNLWINIVSCFRNKNLEPTLKIPRLRISTWEKKLGTLIFSALMLGQIQIASENYAISA